MFRPRYMFEIAFLALVFGVIMFPAARLCQEKDEVEDNRRLKGFVRFIPNDQGDIDWELEGTAAQFISPEVIQVDDLFATSHNGEIGHLTIEVNRAFYKTGVEEAEAKNEWVTIRRGISVLTGKGIIWTPVKKQIRVLESVRVLIKEKDDLGLFPL